MRPNATHTSCGRNAGTQALQTASAQPQATPSPTDILPPYAFPKQWNAAPDGVDLPQWPSLVGSFDFSPSSPQTGYFCGVSPDQVDDSPSTRPAVPATNNGGQTWQQISSPSSRYKTTCQMFINQSNPRDIFVAAGNASDPNSLTLPLFRSQDGGASWMTINQPTMKGTSTFIVGLAVVQSRILIMIGPEGAVGGRYGQH
jgi:hypothetical protein